MKAQDTVSPEVEFARADSNQAEILGEMTVSPQKPEIDTMMPKVDEEDEESDNDESLTPTTKRIRKSSRKLNIMKIDSKKSSNIDLVS